MNRGIVQALGVCVCMLECLCVCVCIYNYSNSNIPFSRPDLCPSQDLTLPMTSYFSGEGMNRGIVHIYICIDSYIDIDIDIYRSMDILIDR